MTASVPPRPNLSKSQALAIAQSSTNRLVGLIPSMATDLSPVTIYQPTASFTFGVTPGNPPNVPIDSSYGVWVAPDENGDGSTWYAVVECFGGGGGGGGGNGTQGGGGGGGGEYAREDQYPITPGASYVYAVGLGGSGDFNTTETIDISPGTGGGVTVFDVAGRGLAGGVMANGGQGGDMTAVGIGGSGGTGSTNTVHFDGGAGGTNVSGNGSDNPLTLAETSGMFAGNTLSTSIITTWHIMNDSNFGSATRNDSTLQGHTATWQDFQGDFITAELSPAAPNQVPAYTSLPFGPYGPNRTQQGWTSIFNPAGGTNHAAARLSANCPGFGTGTAWTVSGWIQAPSQGTWGNPANGSLAIIAANSKNVTISALKGYGLYFFQNNGTWQLQGAIGNGTNRYAVVSSSVPPVPGTWYYIVLTYSSSTLKLYVNGTLAQQVTTTAFTHAPGGAYDTTMGLDPSLTQYWFFGAVSNFWWANDALTSTGITQAFGLSPATGGAGGGASGGPSAAGGAGASASGATGGAGGTPAVQPANLVVTTTPAMGGYAGANANHSNPSPSPPAQGSYGGGGGAAGSMTSPPATSVVVVPFTSAATYEGTDASNTPGDPYNVSQQAHTGSGVNTLLFAGGLASDTDTGSKNTLMLLPPGLKAQLGSGAWTVQYVLLTFTNAFPNNTVESILEVGYSTTDTSLPQTYTGASFAATIAAIPIPVGSGTITYDLTPSGFGDNLTGAGAAPVATALVLGPGATPTFDAYNAPTGPEFYASIYGPGAYDTAGNPQFPYLTVVLQKTQTVQQGSPGASGAIVITNAANSTPVAFVEPYAGTDAAGNQFAQGFTGNTTAFDPTVTSPGSFKPEVWKTASLLNNWIQQGGQDTVAYRMLPNGDVEVKGVLNTNGGTVTSRVFAQVPSAYRPLSNGHVFQAVNTTSNQLVQYGSIDTSGNLSIQGAAVNVSYAIAIGGSFALT